MFENLQDRFERAFKVLKGQGQITEINVAETLKEVRRALLEADVSFNTAKAFTNRVKERALGQNVLNSISPSQLLVKITQEELTELMGSEKADINVNGNPGIVLMSGLQGSGKTTFSGKLANYLKTKKNKFILTIFEKRVSDKEIPFFMKLMELLNNSNINCPKPLRSKNGSHLIKLKNKTKTQLTTQANNVTFKNQRPFKLKNKHCLTQKAGER